MEVNAVVEVARCGLLAAPAAGTSFDTVSLSVSLTGGVAPERADEVGGAPAPGTVCFDMVMYLTTVPKEMCIIANFTVR